MRRHPCSALNPPPVHLLPSNQGRPLGDCHTHVIIEHAGIRFGFVGLCELSC